MEIEVDGFKRLFQVVKIDNSSHVIGRDRVFLLHCKSLETRSHGRIRCSTASEHGTCRCKYWLSGDVIEQVNQCNLIVPDVLLPLVPKPNYFITE